MFLLYAAFPGNSESDEQGLTRRRGEGEWREQDNWMEDGGRQSLKNYQKGGKRKKAFTVTLL